MPSKERLRELFDYRDGMFYRGICKGRKHKGELAGCRGPLGYWHIGVDDRRLLLHRTIWVYHNGPIPPGMVVDHIDHDKGNSRIENLRLVTVTDNNRNQPKFRNTQAPYAGVYPHRNKWHARMHKRHLGTFDTPEEAHHARRAEEARLGFHPNHGKRKATTEAVASLAA